MKFVVALFVYLAICSAAPSDPTTDEQNRPNDLFSVDADAKGDSSGTSDEPSDRSKRFIFFGLLPYPYPVVSYAAPVVRYTYAVPQVTVVKPVTTVVESVPVATVTKTVTTSVENV